ncbi:hypothetical protein ACIQLG_16800 [Terribacillus saccharophilus]|uniref:hypothetical protein n=1 Tax=Terribacillus saccharophilus TaxID=361277 RepID=UPI0038181ABD
MNLLEIPAVQGALVGALATMLINYFLSYREERKKSEQVQFVSKESCRRILVYLSTMRDEEDQEAQKNLESRIDGIKVIQQLLSEMQLNLIPKKDIGIIYRIREKVQEIINDLEIFHHNRTTVRQFTANAEALIIRHDTDEVTRKQLQDEMKIHNNALQTDYERVCKDIDQHIEHLASFLHHYKDLRNKISNINN